MAMLKINPSRYSEELFNQLLEGGIDETLAKHIAHMFIRDPLQVNEYHFLYTYNIYYK